MAKSLQTYSRNLFCKQLFKNFNVQRLLLSQSIKFKTQLSIRCTRSFSSILHSHHIWRFSNQKVHYSRNHNPIMANDNIVAAIQMTSTHDKEENFRKVSKMIDEAVKKNAKAVFLPEGFDFLGRNKTEITSLSETLNGPLIQQYREKAKENGIWLFLGGFHEILDSKRDDGQPWLGNSHIAINDLGTIVSIYRKTHLFDVVLPEHNINLQESSYVKGGVEILRPVATPVGHVGLGICYDLRFPEFSLQLRRLGSEIITYPSAFTVITGQAHWETLLRARAIETQCYVIAAAQVGRHNEKRESYGHSMIIDGWGTILAHAETDREQVIYAPIELSPLVEKRKRMPVESHRRYDLYGAGTVFSIPDESLNEALFPFGQVQIKGKFVFLQSRFSFATVNKKCVVPGHVLIISKRNTLRLKDLTSVEIADLFMLAQKVIQILDAFHSTSSSTLASQDGPQAGQSIEHVHIHVLPRRPHDFVKNDDIYAKLESHDKGEVVWRDEDEMQVEANALRNHIRNHNTEILQ